MLEAIEYLKVVNQDLTEEGERKFECGHRGAGAFRTKFSLQYLERFPAGAVLVSEGIDRSRCWDHRSGRFCAEAYGHAFVVIGTPQETIKTKHTHPPFSFGTRLPLASHPCSEFIPRSTIRIHHAQRTTRVTTSINPKQYSEIVIFI